MTAELMARPEYQEMIRPAAVARQQRLVVLSANPLSDIRNTTKIRAVVYNGQLHERSSLDGLLRRAENEARES
jgi:hypothetical protein